MNEEEVKIKEVYVNHYPLDTHKVSCCLREGKINNLKNKDAHKEKEKKFIEKDVFDFKTKKKKRKNKKKP